MNTGLKASLVAIGALALPFTAAADDSPKEPIQLARADTSAQQANFNGAAEGKAVELIHGSGVADLDVATIKQALENVGCTFSSRSLGDRSRMMVLVEDALVISTDDILAAASEAIEHCAPKQG